MGTPYPPGSWNASNLYQFLYLFPLADGYRRFSVTILHQGMVTEDLPQPCMQYALDVGPTQDKQTSLFILWAYPSLLVATETRTVGKRTVRILLECCLVTGNCWHRSVPWPSRVITGKIFKSLRLWWIHILTKQVEKRAQKKVQFVNCWLCTTYIQLNRTCYIWKSLSVHFLFLLVIYKCLMSDILRPNSPAWGI